MRFKPWLGILLALTLLACRAEGGRSLTLGAYTTPREAFREINRDFRELWRRERGEEISIRESYLGSGAQSRAVADGFPADVVALSLEPDVARLEKAGLITHDWKAQDGGMVTRSLVAFAVREGNPKGIHDWGDLARSDVEVLSSNPRTSGGAMWNVLAAYGAARLGKARGFSADAEGAKAYLAALLKRVIAMDKGARESLLVFEKGLGDVALSYENEIEVGRKQSLGYPYEQVTPSATILIENPVALVDRNVEAHGNRDLAEAYVRYLFSAPAQEVFRKHGFRGAADPVSSEGVEIFTIADFGDWDRAVAEIFGEQGVFPLALQAAQQSQRGAR